MVRLMTDYTGEIQEAARLIGNAKKAAAFCGSGVSAESGIATFRDPGGIWDRFDPLEVGTPEGFLSSLTRNPRSLAPLALELIEAFEKAECNPGHIALAELEEMGILKTVITQNIDNLQREAGSANLVEVHGNLFRLVCISCGKGRAYERRPFIAEMKERLGRLTDFSLPGLAAIVPVCEACGSLMRPDVVMFGEAVRELPRAYHAARVCDAMLVLGTSGTVFPAAAIPFEAKRGGAPVIVVNPRENAFGEITDVFIPMKFGEAVPAILRAIQER